MRICAFGTIFAGFSIALTRILVLRMLRTDKLHNIVRNWQPGKYTKSFLCHLVELVHTTLKTLEWFQKDKTIYIGGVDVSMPDGQEDGGRVDKAVLDRVASAKKFDFHRYFRRLATNP